MVKKKSQKVFEKIVLGQTILKFKTPVETLDEINSVYQNKFDQLPDSNYRLVGKIKKEKSIYYTFKGKEHNFLSKNALRFFEYGFRSYLIETKQTTFDMKVTSVWINEMHEHEYNPVHTHLSHTSKIGLTSVMFLKIPDTYGKEYSRKELPNNGKLQLIGNVGGQFVNNDYYPKAEVGDFYIFPFDMKHCVYPFNSTKEERRTLSANCDVY